MYRKKGELIPLEASILRTGLELRARGQVAFHGFGIASEMRDRGEAKRLTAYGSLYRALDRMERAGLLTSSWEDSPPSASRGRPRRRLYEVTAAGEAALAALPIKTASGLEFDQGLSSP
jgi:DNA-binding PadR family transcriptional regulator